MIRAVVWKEIREQGLIALTLAILGGGLLIATAILADPPAPGAPATDVIRFLGPGRLVTLMLVVTSGMVCGGALFAAERESGTMSFLDALPTARWALWRAKLIAGLVLAVAQVTVLLTIAWVMDVADGAFAGRLVIYVVLAFSWGALGSTLARTTLGSVGIAIPTAALATFVFLLPITLFFAQPGSGMPRPIGWLLFQLLMVTAPLFVSWWRFTAPDRARAASAADIPQPLRRIADRPAVRSDTSAAPPQFEPAGSGAPAAAGRAGFGLRSLVWLTVRQLWLPGTILSTFAISFGLSMLLPDLPAVFLWPVLVLAAGALVGVLAFGDEQSHHTALFWGEHRLPIGRAWWVKILLCLVLLSWLLVLLALPSFVRAQFEPARGFGRGRNTFAAVFQTRLFDDMGAQTWKYLLVPAVYGFAFGHLCGLLFRKLVVACGVALMLGGVCAALWVPSLLSGGVAHWQVWIPACVVLLTARLVIRSWAGDRTGTRGPVRRLVWGGSAAVLTLAAGIGYRAIEVRDDPGGADDVVLVAKQPSYDENVGGREFRATVDRFARAAQTEDRSGVAQRRSRTDERLEAVTRAGWAASDPGLAAWLNGVFADQPTGPEDKPWPVMAAVAAERPIGIYESPQLVSSAAATAAALDNAKRMAVALLARGLQLQAGADPAALTALGSATPYAALGDPAALAVLARAVQHRALGDSAPFVEMFQIAVALARNVRNGTGVQALESAIEIERLAMVATERWLDRLGSTGSDLLRAVVRTGTGADDSAPFDLHPHLLVDRFVVRGLMQAPAGWLTTAYSPAGAGAERIVPEADMVAFAWSVPWERERTRRLVGNTPEGMPRAELMALTAGRPGATVLLGRNRTTASLEVSDTLLRVSRRAVILKAAIRAYQADRGRLPPTAVELVVHGYLARLPEDPYSEGKPFGYRVSTGEELVGPPRAVVGQPSDTRYVVPVKAGQVVLWSVGVDRVDQGGKVPPGGPRAEDIVFLVPLPAN